MAAEAVKMMPGDVKHSKLITKAHADGERVLTIKLLEAINVTTHQGYETLNHITKDTGGPAHRGKWSIYVVGPWVYVWHEGSKRVTRTPVSNVIYIDEMPADQS